MDKITFVIPCEKMNMFKLFNMPPYGPVLLATILHTKGYDVRVKDEQNMNIKMSDLKQTDVLLISALTSTIDRAYELAKEFKKHFARPVIMGGMHVSALPREALENGADLVITGEAELTLPAVLENLNRYLSLPVNERIIGGELVKDLDALPFLEFELIDKFSKDISLKNMNLTLVPVLPFRGCVNRCKFCASWKVGGLRSRSAENVISELDALINSGYTMFYFNSDYFSWNKQKSGELLTAMKAIRFNERSKWTMIQDSVRMAFKAGGGIDHAYLDLLKEAGVTQIGLGIESLQEHSFIDLVGVTGKKQYASQSLEALKAIREHGMQPYSFLMAGAENQTPAEIINNVKIAKMYGVGQIPVLTPFPGTQLYTEMKKDGKILLDGPGNWKYYDAMNLVFKHNSLSRYELKKAVIKAWKTFFSYRDAAFFMLKAIGNIILLKPGKFMDYVYLALVHITELRLVGQINKKLMKEKFI